MCLKKGRRVAFSTYITKVEPSSGNSRSSVLPPPKGVDQGTRFCPAPAPKGHGRVLGGETLPRFTSLLRQNDVVDDG